MLESMWSETREEDRVALDVIAAVVRIGLD